MKKTVLCYLLKDDMVLMLHRNKKENDINEGKWVGVGGHIIDGESAEVALKREVLEETGYVLSDYNKRGIVEFHNDDGYSEITYVYTSENFCGEIIKCDEGDLAWINKNEIYGLNLWEGDKVFLDILFNDIVYFEFKLYYSGDKLIRSERVR